MWNLTKFSSSIKKQWNLKGIDRLCKDPSSGLSRTFLFCFLKFNWHRQMFWKLFNFWPKFTSYLPQDFGKSFLKSRQKDNTNNTLQQWFSIAHNTTCNYIAWYIHHTYTTQNTCYISWISFYYLKVGSNQWSTQIPHRILHLSIFNIFS